MSSFSFYTSPPNGWREICDAEGSFFNSIEWQAVLNRSLNAKTLYVVDRNKETSLTIPIFRGGPFRIGYLGFPATTCLGEGEINNETILNIKKATLPANLHLLRIPTSPFLKNSNLNLRSTKVPETAISDLQNWDVCLLNATVRRNVRKAQKSGVVVSSANEYKFGDIFFRLYADTVKRNGGSIRYTQSYFHGLIELSRTNHAIRCFIAQVNGELAGFVIIGLDKKVAYYLHGASTPQLRKFRPNDILFSEAISWAKEQGMEMFNFMASPISQPSLIRYKEKWGAETRTQHVYQDETRMIQAKLFLAAKNISNIYELFQAKIIK